MHQFCKRRASEPKNEAENISVIVCPKQQHKWNHTEKAFSIETSIKLACHHRKTEGIGRAKWPGTAGTTGTVLEPHTYSAEISRDQQRSAENIVHSHGSTKKAPTLSWCMGVHQGASGGIVVHRGAMLASQNNSTSWNQPGPVRQLRRHGSRNRHHSFHTGCPAQACFILLESLDCGQRMVKVVFYSFRFSESSTVQPPFLPRKDLLVAHFASSEHSSHRLWGFPKNGMSRHSANNRKKA